MPAELSLLGSSDEVLLDRVAEAVAVGVVAAVAACRRGSSRERAGSRPPYSVPLLRPSPSASADASGALAGSRPCWRSQPSGRPSPSESALRGLLPRRSSTESGIAVAVGVAIAEVACRRPAAPASSALGAGRAGSVDTVPAGGGQRRGAGRAAASAGAGHDARGPPRPAAAPGERGPARRRALPDVAVRRPGRPARAKGSDVAAQAYQAAARRARPATPIAEHREAASEPARAGERREPIGPWPGVIGRARQIGLKRRLGARSAARRSDSKARSWPDVRIAAAEVGAPPLV